MLSPTTTRYNRVAVILHWVIALLMVFMLFPGEDLIRVPRGGDMSSWQPSAHASIGLTIFILTAIRVWWRVTHKPTPHVKPMPRWQSIAAEATHGLFYVLLLGMPISGMLALQGYGAERLNPEAVKFFQLFSLYGLPNLGHWTSSAHEFAGLIAKLLLGLHVLAALKHQFMD